jgi:protein SCO1/2
VKAHAKRFYFSGLLLTLLLRVCSASGVQAPSTAPSMPEALAGVGVTERPGQPLPLDLNFTNELGQGVTLRQYFRSGRPVILQLGYYRCPMLCGLISKGLAESLKGLDLKMGKDFEAISISFDPAETPKLAAAKKQTYLEELNRPDEAGGWHFLVGSPGSIRKITQAVGFEYRWVESQKQYSHPAVLVVLMPDGRVSRYLYGVNFPAKTLRLSLVEASENKIGTTMDRVMLFCFNYDPNTGRYALAARNLMRLGGVLTVAILGLVLVRLFVREARSRRAAAGK